MEQRLFPDSPFFMRVKQMCADLKDLGVRLKKAESVTDVTIKLANLSREILVCDQIVTRRVSKEALKEADSLIESLDKLEKILVHQPDDEVLGYFSARFHNTYSSDFPPEDLTATRSSVGILLSRFRKFRSEVNKISSEMPNARSAAGIENGKKKLTVRNQKVVNVIAEIADRYFEDVSPADIHRDRDDVRNIHGNYFELAWAVFAVLDLKNRDDVPYKDTGLHALLCRHTPQRIDNIEN